MANYFDFFNKTLKNKVFYYIFSRYATYFIQFINSIFIALYLGPYFLGVWGFITLIIQYLNQSNFGISQSANAIISIHKSDTKYVQEIVGGSLTMLFFLSVFIIIFYIVILIFGFQIGEKYHFLQYAPFVVVIGIMGYFTTFMSNVFRVFGRIKEIAINQSAFPVLMLVMILFFKGEGLLWALVIANILALVLSLLLYFINTPVNLTPIFKRYLIKTIQAKGWHLFVYNTCFYLIVISTRSIVSGFYSVEEFGYFTFAFSLATAIMLFLDSISFLNYPKMLNRFANLENDKSYIILSKLRSIYIVIAHMVVHAALLLFPIFILLIPQYEKSILAFELVALSTVLYSNSFGYSDLLIARGYEKKLSLLSFFALLINIVTAYLLTAILSLSFSHVILATMLTYFIYVFILGYIGRKLLKLETNVMDVFNDIYPIRIILPYLFALGLSLLSVPGYFYLSSLALFLVMNFKTIQISKAFIKEVYNNPNLTDV